MSSAIECDTVIIGGGVIGCAIAESLSSKFKDQSVVVLEAGPRIGEGTTSRNSGVVHAGIYYPPTSLKAKLCVEGNKRLYLWAEKYHVPFKKIGKVIVAKDNQQIEGLEKLLRNAKESGAKNLRLVDKKELSKLEPHLNMEAALFSPETGIIDQYELTRSLAVVAQNQGATFGFNCEVKSIEKKAGSYFLATTDGSIQASRVINCAGLFADDIAAMIGIHKYKIFPCRGDYFSFKPKVQFNHLIYPLKESNAAGLGIHLTVDTGGKWRLGPDAQYVPSKRDFKPEESKLEAFHEAATKLLGEGNITDLQYDFCGIRPKLRSPDEKEEKDFIISQDLPGFINLVGIESPGLTASLAMAEYVAALF